MFIKVVFCLFFLFFYSCLILSSVGSAEDLIKQELQNVAEGVAASVLQSALPSNPDLTVYEGNEPAHEAYQEKDVQQDADTEVLKLFCVLQSVGYQVASSFKCINIMIMYLLHLSCRMLILQWQRG